MENPQTWELIEQESDSAADRIHRIKVPGGWIYRIGTRATDTTVAFVPDPTFSSRL